MPARLPPQPGVVCPIRRRRVVRIALAGAGVGGLAMLWSVTPGWAHNPDGRVMEGRVMGGRVMGGRVMGGIATPFSKLRGWADDAQSAALVAFRRSCPRAGRGHSTKAARALRAVCAEAEKLPAAIGDNLARRFFETHFEPVAVVTGGQGAGLFTGYFEPELDAALRPSKEFSVPLRAPPENLVNLARLGDRQGLPGALTHALKVDGRLQIVPTRAQIEAGALDHSAAPIAWVRNAVDAFFLHIQGSGRLRLPDGRHIRVTYAGKNGHSYTSIGKVLVERGDLDKAGVSMQSIRAWMAANPDKAGALMNKNRSYIFFNLVANDTTGLGPPGQMGVALTPGRSLAVDLAYHTPGLPIWLETIVPGVPGENGGAYQPFRRLMIAQDTGSAIRGPQRGDIFFGTGAPAGQRAGRMRAPGAMFVLRPREGL